MMHRLSVVLCTLVCGGMVAAQSNRNRVDPLKMPEVSKQELICFALYTVHDQTLKLTAQLYPLDDDDPRVVRLEVQTDDGWQEIDRVTVIEDGWTAPFRVDDWDDSKSHAYRVRHGEEAVYEGTIRKNPIDKESIVVAGFTGNSVSYKHGGDIARQDLIDNVKRIDADVLFFSGDQVYDHRRHYLGWLKFGRDF
ncbi:MAG: hypothetical protein AAF539_15605, partial [Planctomycetota bacterium]